MTKQEKRSIMYAIAQMNMSDGDVKTFINLLAKAQLFKPKQAYINFCTDLAILYTTEVITFSILKDKIRKDSLEWQENFIEDCADLIFKGSLND